MATIKTNEIITNNFVRSLSEGIIPWEKGWVIDEDRHFTGNGITGHKYSLLNRMLVSHPGKYYTIKQLLAKKATIVDECPAHLIGKEFGRKNDKRVMTQSEWDNLSTEYRFNLLHDMVTYWNTEEKETGKLNDDGTPEKKKFFFLRYYYVVWEGYTSLYEGEPEEPEKAPRFDKGDNLMKFYTSREGIRLLEENGSEAFYRPSDDSIHLPAMEQFKYMEEFYSTAFHEMTHSTGVSKRLDRDMTGRFGSKSYAREELVAEIGASFLTNKFGIRTDKVERNNTAYIQNWISALQKDPDLIIKAASKAEKAMGFILDGWTEPTEEPEPTPEAPKEDPKPSKPVKSKRYLLGCFDKDEITAKQFDGYDVEYDNTTYFVHKSPKGTCWQISCPRTGRLLANRLVTGWNTRKEAIEAIPDIHPIYIKVLAKGVAEYVASYKKYIRKAEEQ